MAPERENLIGDNIIHSNEIERNMKPATQSAINAIVSEIS